MFVIMVSYKTLPSKNAYNHHFNSNRYDAKIISIIIFIWCNYRAINSMLYSNTINISKKCRRTYGTPFTLQGNCNCYRLGGLCPIIALVFPTVAHMLGTWIRSAYADGGIAAYTQRWCMVGLSCTYNCTDNIKIEIYISWVIMYIWLYW